MNETINKIEKIGKTGFFGLFWIFSVLYTFNLMLLNHIISLLQDYDHDLTFNSKYISFVFSGEYIIISSLFILPVVGFYISSSIKDYLKKDSGGT